LTKLVFSFAHLVVLVVHSVTQAT